MRAPGFLACTVLACAHSTTPPPAGAPAPRAGGLVEHVVRPEQADPTADRWLEDQYAYLDRGAAPAGKLVVYLVGAGGKPAGSRAMMKELAAMGFATLAPMYANDYQIANVCAPARDSDDDCHGKARLEAFEGGDKSPHLEATRANSAEGRVARMLAHLARAFPDEGWGAYLDGDGPRWESIIVAGHSHGASSAGLVGKVRKVARVVMLSGPFDNRGGEPAAWTRAPSATPVDRFYGFSHARESQHRGHLRDWEAMGLGALGAAVTIEGATPPFGGSHQLITGVEVVGGKDPHGTTTASGASPRDPAGAYQFTPVWRYLFGR